MTGQLWRLKLLGFKITIGGGLSMRNKSGGPLKLTKSRLPWIYQVRSTFALLQEETAVSRERFA